MSIKISVAAMIMRVSGPVTPHYETHGATLPGDTGFWSTEGGVPQEEGFSPN